MDLRFWFVVGYLGLVSALGVYYGKYIKSEEDYTLAGRRLSGIILAGTLLATWMGSGTVVGGTNALAYNYGPWVAIIFMMAVPIGILLLYLLVSKIREASYHTIPEQLGRKYGSPARILGSLIIMLAYVGIVSYQYSGIGFVLNATLGISTEAGTTIAAILVILIALFGGLISVAYTDFLSAVIMLLGLCVGVPYAIYAAGGWSSIAARLPPENLGLGGLTPLQVFGYFLPLLLLLLGEQNMQQRIIAGRSSKAAKKGLIGWALGAIITAFCVAFGSTTSRALFPDIPAGQGLIMLATKAMPPVLGGLMLAAITGFILTTADSYLLSSATNLGWDIYATYINPNATDKQKLIITRSMVIILGIFAYLLIMYFPTVLAVQMYAYTMYGAAITPALLASLLWKRATPIAGISSMAIGAIITLIWELSGKPFNLDSVLIAAPLSILVLVVLGYLTYKEGS